MRKTNRRRAFVESMELRLLLSSSDTASLALSLRPLTIEGTTYVIVAVNYSGKMVQASTFGNGNLLISGPNAFPGTITYTGTGPGIAGAAEAFYQIAGTVPVADNGNTYTVSVAPNQVSDGLGGYFPAQTLGTFTIQFAIPTAPPVIILGSNNQPLASGATVDFVGVTGSRTVRVKNIGTRPLQFEDDIPDTTDHFTGVPILEFDSTPHRPSATTATLPPGGTDRVRFHLNPSAEVGYPFQWVWTMRFTNPTPYISYTPLMLDLTNAPPTLISSHTPSIYFDLSAEVRVSLTGPGTATLVFGPGPYFYGPPDSVLTDLTIDNTTDASALTIAMIGPARKGYHTTLGDVQINGSLGSFNAPLVDLSASSFVASGAVQNLSIGNVAGLETFQIGGNLMTALRFVAGNISDATLSSNEPISLLRVRNWTDTHAFDSQVNSFEEQIMAPSIQNLICGGDFTVGLDVTNGNSAIGNMMIGGAVGSDSWVIAGDARQIRIGSISSDFSASVDGTLSALTVSGDDDGVFAAGDFGKIRIGGSMRGGKLLAGVNLGTSGRIGPTNTYARGSIASLIVVGAGTGIFISAGFEPADSLFDNTTGQLIGGNASAIGFLRFQHGIDSSSRFVAGAFGPAYAPERVNIKVDTRFVQL